MSLSGAIKRRVHVLLSREGWEANHKLVYRLYREEGLGLRRKRLEHGFRGRSARAGKPTDNADVESFNGRLRDELALVRFDGGRKASNQCVARRLQREPASQGYAAGIRPEKEPKTLNQPGTKSG
jgi:putative transposase